MADSVLKWHQWLVLDEKWLPKLTESLKNIEIDGNLQKMSWDEQLEYLVPDWIEKVTKLYGEKGTSRNEKGYKSENLYNAEYQQYDYTKDTSSNEKGYKSDEENRPSPNEKVTKLSNKKIRYIIVILLMLGSPLSVEELMALFEYNNKGKFRDIYLKPLEAAGLLTKTNPDKPTASNQKYVITEKGKRFLNGQNF